MNGGLEETGLMTILYFIIALGALIFVHELGHFILAKRAGIFVEVFSLGFGPRLVGVKIGETDYRICAFPLGGYVKMRGEEPGEEGSSDPRSFAAKGIWARAKVILFGPLMNLFLCLALMPVVYMIGRAEPAYLSQPPVVSAVKADSPAVEAGLKEGDRIVAVDGKKVATWEDVLNKVLLGPRSTLTFTVDRNNKTFESPVNVGELPEIKGGYVGIEPMLFVGSEAKIDGVRAGGAAAEAGLMPGDVVLSVGGKAVNDWLDLTRLVNETGGKETEFVIERDGTRLEKRVTPILSQDFGRYVIGISKDRMSGVPMVVNKYSFTAAIVKGTKENIKLAGLTLDVLKRLLSFKLSYKVLGGPIIIAKTSAAAAASGLASFLYFLSFLSLQLAILNFLPIPVLDGGQLVFLGIEALMRRPLSVRVRLVAHHVGFALLISLMLLVTVNDIDSVWGLRALLHRIF